jgi:hypothetical protein
MLTQHLGSGGALAFVAVLVGALVRLLRTGRANALLAKFGIGPIPTHVLPWLALIFGSAAQLLDAYLTGAVTMQSASLAALDGVLAGALAIAGHEAVVKAPQRRAEAKQAAEPKVEEPTPKADESKAEPSPEDAPAVEVVEESETKSAQV